MIGRDPDLERIRARLGIGAGGGALLLSGDAGVGKTAVLDVLAGAASAEGTRVLRAAGVEFEADFSYSGSGPPTSARGAPTAAAGWRRRPMSAPSPPAPRP
ncbi:AAA family ATPase [Streptomyces sp. GC420]|uniref:AAA family ATPase n=1 Tax=Streptomyces sp. GC420 TaxID=2697568 RepID=UPI0014153071|nr:AAA family ATPase [Streptomyces sp. GC420]